MEARRAVLRPWIGVPLACGILGVSGCSATRPPTETFAKADVAVHQAEASKAPQYAPLELRLAREKLEKAKAAMASDDNEEARLLAEQALVDAQLAEAKAESEGERQRAQELRKTIETLHAEAERTSTVSTPSL
jgi:hypothetical protein